TRIFFHRALPSPALFTRAPANFCRDELAENWLANRTSHVSDSAAMWAKSHASILFQQTLGFGGVRLDFVLLDFDARHPHLMLHPVAVKFVKENDHPCPLSFGHSDCAGCLGLQKIDDTPPA